jgi:ApaG protein
LRTIVDSVQLTSRHWEIYDSLNNIEIVDGEGIIGKKTSSKPGELHTYSSDVYYPPYGAMKGYFNTFTSTKNLKFCTHLNYVSLALN